MNGISKKIKIRCDYYLKHFFPLPCFKWLYNFNAHAILNSFRIKKGSFLNFFGSNHICNNGGYNDQNSSIVVWWSDGGCNKRRCERLFPLVSIAQIFWYVIMYNCRSCVHTHTFYENICDYINGLSWVIRIHIPKKDCKCMTASHAILGYRK